MPLHIRSVALFLLLSVAVTARAQTDAFDLEPGTRVLAPIQYQQLTVFPVVKQAREAVDKNKYLTLSAGLKEKLVVVAENQGGAEVNRVSVDNKSAKPLLLLGGEVILGGQQDRVIGQDTIIPPKQKAVVEVYCVEHGRWSGHQEFTASGGLAESRIRANAKFNRDQGAVWQEVATKNAALKADNATGTYRDVATGKEGDKAIKPYQTNVGDKLEKLADADKIVGLIAAVNGRVVSVDLFQNPELFSSYKEGLLKSLFVSVAGTPAEAKPAPAPSAAVIKEFMQKADKAAPSAAEKRGKASTIRNDSGDVAKSTLSDGDGPAAPAVYRSYQVK